MAKVSLGRARKVKTSVKKAILFELLDDRGRKLWVPDFAVHDDSEVYAGGNETVGNLVVTSSWAEENGLS